MNETLALQLLPYAIMILGPGGAAWVAVKVSLNGTKQDVKEIKKDLKELQHNMSKVEQDMSFLFGRDEGRDDARHDVKG